MPWATDVDSTKGGWAMPWVTGVDTSVLHARTRGGLGAAGEGVLSQVPTVYLCSVIMCCIS